MCALKHSLWSMKPEKCALWYLKHTFPFDLAHAKFYNDMIFLRILTFPFFFFPVIFKSDWLGDIYYVNK